MIISFILVTFMFDSGVVLWGEVRIKWLLGVKWSGAYCCYNVLVVLCVRWHQWAQYVLQSSTVDSNIFMVLRKSSNAFNKTFFICLPGNLMLFWSSAPRVRNTLQKLSRFLSFCHAEISYSFLDLSATLKKKKSFTGSKSLAMFVLILQDKNCWLLTNWFAV